ncbi:hypothetical protein [Delftia lacustris]|uniref:hypothetical protein n=1 Tax=Delftia lacustris TaxID=558537 RepID=UPI00069ACE4F|nr:hypothetical protein [Delftia lacustris]
MSDQNTDTADATDDNATDETRDSQEDTDVETEDESTSADDDGFDPEKAREKIRKINSENRNLRKRAADAEAKAQGADEKDKKLTALEADNMRLRVAVKHGLPESLVKRLTGTTEEEILQDAEELMELFGSKKPPTQQPKEKLRSPGDPSGNAEIDVEKVVQRVFEH